MYKELLREARAALPNWVQDNPRYARLYQLNRWIDGEFYEHIPTPFVVEKTSGNVYVPISVRRPHFLFNIPRQVAIKTARKLFSGRQKPSLVHDDADLLTAAHALLSEGFFDTRMLDAGVKGSVGAVAMTWDFRKDGDGTLRILFETHRSRDCFPVFDALGELKSLRVVKCNYGQDFFEVGVVTDCKNEPLKAGRQYWEVRIFDTVGNYSCRPIPYDDYNPTKPEDFKLQVVDEERSTLHNLRFVQGHWMVNLTGAKNTVDGCCAWETAISSCITLDYTLSQLVRGVWYSAAPTPVIKGKVINQEESENGVVISGPANALQFDAERRDPAGNSMGAGDAHLLETNGAGLSETRETCEMLRKFILEQIQASRKDPDRMRTSAMSGAAMEQMDEDSLDMVQDLRTALGDEGGLVVTKKAMVAAKLLEHPALTSVDINAIKALSYQWPSIYNLSSHELLETVQALVLAVGGAEQGPNSGTSGAGSSSTSSGSPASSSGTADDDASDDKTAPAPVPIALITEQEAQQIIKGLLNLPRMAASKTAAVSQQMPVVEPGKEVEDSGKATE